MKIIDVPQGSLEWKQARAGKVTASRVSDMMATRKDKTEAAGRKNYRAEKVAEILTGEPYPDGFQSGSMKWGIEQEPYGRAAYEVAQDVIVDTVGFVVHPTMDRFGCSPDGLVGAKGMVQFKCPDTAQHLEYLLGNRLPPDYVDQCASELECAEREWIDFCSFDPRLQAAGLQLFVVRIYKAELEIRTQAIKNEIGKFLSEVDALVERLRNR